MHAYNLAYRPLSSIDASNPVILRVHEHWRGVASDLMTRLREYLGEDPALVEGLEGTEVEKPAPVTTILERQKTPNKIAKGLESDDGSNAARTTLVRALRPGNQHPSSHDRPGVAPQPTHSTPPITTRESPSPRDSTLIFEFPSRMAHPHRVTDHHPTAEPEATRLVKRKLADLRSHASTRTSDDGPPLIQMARPVWDPSEFLDIDVPASKRVTSGYLLKTMYNCPTVEPEVVRPTKRRKFAGLHSHGSTRTSDDRPSLMAHPVPELSGLPGLDLPACKRLISGSLSQQQVISLIQAIFTSKDEVAMIRDLRGDDAQAFVDVVNEVHSTSSHLSFWLL